MTYLYVMTFGSFIGFSASFPKLIADLFPSVEPLRYAWLGAFVGSVVRPVGGWMSDKWSGAKVTHYTVIAMIFLVVGVGVVVLEADKSPEKEDVLFPIFLILFLLLFITTGIGNASTYRMVSIIFPKHEAGPVLGWTSAIAAYGAFVVPIIFAASITWGVVWYSFWGFAVYYISCLALNWYYYARAGAEIPC